MSRSHSTARGDIWIIDYEPGVTGHEQGGSPRPSVIVSSSDLDSNQAGLVIVVPSTRTRRPRSGELLPNHYEVKPTKQNGLASISYFMCEQIRSISINRLQNRIGKLSPEDMFQIEERLIILMDLGV